MLALAASAASLALAGCSPAPSPPQLPTEQAILADHQVLLDASWALLDLPPGTQRPGIETPELVDGSTWWDNNLECMEATLPNQVFTWVDADWYMAMGVNSEPLSTRDQLVFYGCLTRYVDSGFGVIRLLTDEHLEHLWRYYERWLMPCITRVGFEAGLTVASPPTFEAFVADHARGMLWSPHHNVRFVATPEGLERASVGFRRIDDRCGSQYDALDPESGVFS